MFFIWLAMIGLALVQAPVLVKRQQWGELWTFGTMWLIAVVYATLIQVGAAVPNVFELILNVL